MILKSIFVSLAVALIGSGLLTFAQSGHFVRAAVAFFVVGVISSIATHLISGSSSQSTSGSAPSKKPGSASSKNSSQAQPTAADKNNENREEGEVKWFNISKGFGFITRDAGEDIFVHYRSIRGEGHRSLSEGQRVEYEVVDGDKGLQAEDVVALTPSTRRRR